MSGASSETQHKEFAWWYDVCSVAVSSGVCDHLSHISRFQVHSSLLVLRFCASAAARAFCTPSCNIAPSQIHAHGRASTHTQTFRITHMQSIHSTRRSMRSVQAHHNNWPWLHLCVFCQHVENEYAHFPPVTGRCSHRSMPARILFSMICLFFRRTHALHAEKCCKNIYFFRDAYLGTRSPPRDCHLQAGTITDNGFCMWRSYACSK